MNSEARWAVWSSPPRTAFPAEGCLNHLTNIGDIAKIINTANVYIIVISGPKPLHSSRSNHSRVKVKPRAALLLRQPSIQVIASTLTMSTWLVINFLWSKRQARCSQYFGICLHKLQYSQSRQIIDGVWVNISVETSHHKFGKSCSRPLMNTKISQTAYLFTALQL